MNGNVPLSRADRLLSLARRDCDLRALVICIWRNEDLRDKRVVLTRYILENAIEKHCKRRLKKKNKSHCFQHKKNRLYFYDLKGVTAISCFRTKLRRFA